MTAAPMTVEAQIERWPIEGGFTISRGAKTEAVVIVARVSRGNLIGRGECVPYARYGETAEATLAAVQGMNGKTFDRIALQTLLPPGAARNAVDCALWDLEAKESGKRVWELVGLGKIEIASRRRCKNASGSTPP